MIGPNGAGKTTLLSILAGIREPDSGSISVPGEVGWVPQQAGALPAAHRRGEPAPVRAPRGVRRRRRRRRAHARPDGSARAARRSDRHALGRKPAAGEHRDRPALGARGAPARRAVDRARPAPARAPVGLRPRPRRPGHDGDLHDPPPGRGRALRQPAASSWPTARTSSTAPRTSSTPRCRTPAAATSRPRSSPSCGSAGTDAAHALASPQGPPDPAALAAGHRAAHRLPRRDRDPDRLRALGRRGQAARRVPQRGRPRARASTSAPARTSSAPSEAREPSFATGSSASTSTRAKRPSRWSRTARCSAR